MNQLIDLTGQKFGKLTVISLEKSDKKRKGAVWLCRCECGNIKAVSSRNLRKGCTKSCGCSTKEMIGKANTKHGMNLSRLHRIWSGMKTRCTNSKNKDFELYGGKNIKVAEEWLHDFQAFHDWAIGSGYKENLSLDRIDPNGNYEPDTCRWATMKQQQNNRSNNRLITFNDETHTLSEWAEMLGIERYILNNRIVAQHWTVEKAFTTPVKKHKKSQGPIDKN